MEYCHILLCANDCINGPMQRYMEDRHLNAPQQTKERMIGIDEWASSLIAEVVVSQYMSWHMSSLWRWCWRWRVAERTKEAALFM